MIPYKLHSDGIKLPAYSISEEVNQALIHDNRLIITAAPGAGKSTILPLTIQQGFPHQGKILVIEPRRIAAKQIAERLAYLIHQPVGECVGYQVRFESKFSETSDILVVTEGILTKILQTNPFLEGISVLIFDEFHERTLSSDVSLALVRAIQQQIRSDLRIVLMSATFDSSALSKLFQAPIIACEGRMFPVSIVHAEEDATLQNVVEHVTKTIRRAHTQYEGDMLVFLPGQSEIQRCQLLLADSLKNTEIYPLYGFLSFEEQQRAIAPSTNGFRKVVLATSIAETSLTIEGVKIVIDAGLGRSYVYDPKNGMNHLVTQRISLDRAIQRSGRAGRLSEGVCVRLWTLATEQRMQPCREPEIINADFTSSLLTLYEWGESSILQLPWLTSPTSFHVDQATQLLTSLGAIDQFQKITDLGHQMARIPCHPRIAKMLLSSLTTTMQALATDIAALLEEKDPLNDENEVDIHSRLLLLRRSRQNRELREWTMIERIAQEYRQLISIKVDNTTPSISDVGYLISSAYPERIAKSIDGCGTFKMANGNKAFLSSSDLLSSYEWLAIASLNATSGRIFLAAPLYLEDIPVSLFKEKETLSWNNKQGCFIAQKERRLGAIVVNSQPMKSISSETKLNIICEVAMKEGETLFDWTEAVESLQLRIALVAQWHPELGLPDVSISSVLKCSNEWIPFYMEMKGDYLPILNDFKKISMSEVILSLLTYEQQQEIERLAPSHIVVPTGSKIRVKYRQGAEDPVLSVRLQECFGLTDTPRVNEGKTPVLMELLSPGFKPVQLTKDLRSFWATTYYEVRKELKRRYPKHEWPDSPLDAEAVRGVKKK